MVPRAALSIPDQLLDLWSDGAGHSARIPQLQGQHGSVHSCRGDHVFEVRVLDPVLIKLRLQLIDRQPPCVFVGSVRGRQPHWAPVVTSPRRGLHQQR